MITENIDETVLVEAIGAAEAEVVYCDDKFKIANNTPPDWNC